MKIGAAISGGVHAGLIGLAVLAGDFAGRSEARLLSIAEITLMSGTEFQAALSAAPEFDPAQPPVPAAPQAGDRADIRVARIDAAPMLRPPPRPAEPPTPGDAPVPANNPPAEASLGPIGPAPASPPAPEAERVIAAVDAPADIAPVADRLIAAAPPAQPAPKIADDPPPPPQESLAADPPPPTSAEDKDTATPEVAEKLNPSDVPAPRLSPPPPRRGKDAAEAAKAARLARAPKTPPAETGATKQADAAKGAGSSRTVGRISFRDRDALKIGIKGFFNPPQDLKNEDRIVVTLRVELDRNGRLVKNPVLRRPTGRLDPQHDAIMRAGLRALRRAAAKGVFAELPKEKYDRWRRIDVTFTPREIRFL